MVFFDYEILSPPCSLVGKKGGEIELEVNNIQS